MKNQYVSALSITFAVVGFASMPTASAFDSVTWVWDAAVNSTVDTSAVSSLDVTPSGLTQTENDQKGYGVKTAVSLVTGVDNLIIPAIGGNSIGDLAMIESSALAVGNNATITSDVSVQTDSKQVYSGVGLTVDPLLVSALLPGAISASSSVIGVTNSLVDSSASGLGNNVSLDLTTTSNQDAFAIANNEQLSVSLISTASTVDVVAFDGIVGLEGASSPSVTSAATSVGNNLSVNVSGGF